MEQELKALRAETIAIQAVLTNALFELKLLDPVLADMVSRSLVVYQFEICAASRFL